MWTDKHSRFAFTLSFLSLIIHLNDWQPANGILRTNHCEGKSQPTLWWRKEMRGVRAGGCGSQDGGGGGYSHFFFKRRVWRNIYWSPQNKYQEFQASHKNIWNFGNPQKYPRFSTLTLRKTLKCIEMNTKYSPILWWPPKYIHKIFIPQFFSENPKKYWNLKFWSPKNDLSLRLHKKIRVPLLGCRSSSGASNNASELMSQWQ